MNHTLLAREALRFRLASVHRALDPSRFDLDGAAAFAVSCGDPVVDSAIRRVGTAWLRAGLDPESIVAPWTEANGNRLLEYGGFDVIDALDDIVRTIKTYAVFTSAELGESSAPSLRNLVLFTRLVANTQNACVFATGAPEDPAPETRGDPESAIAHQRARPACRLRSDRNVGSVSNLGITVSPKRRQLSTVTS